MDFNQLRYINEKKNFKRIDDCNFSIGHRRMFKV